jgi:hypothetical protein
LNKFKISWILTLEQANIFEDVYNGEIDAGAHIRGVCGGGVTPPQLFKIGRKSVPNNAYQITNSVPGSVPEHPIY